MFKKLLTYFFQGVLYVAPIGATVYVIYYLFHYLDTLFDMPYPGVGILLLFAGLTLIGILGKFLIQLPLFNYFDNQLKL